MTANTAASQLGNRILQNPSANDVSIEWGKLADAYKPGDIVYQSARGVWTKRASNAGNLCRPGVILDKARVGSDFSHKDIDDAYTTSDDVPICTSGICICKIVDQNSTIDIDVGLISSTAGALTICTTMFELYLVARNMHPVIDNDTYTIAGFGVYKYKGQCPSVERN